MPDTPDPWDREEALKRYYAWTDELRSWLRLREEVSALRRMGARSRIHGGRLGASRSRIAPPPPKTETITFGPARIYASSPIPPDSVPFGETWGRGWIDLGMTGTDPIGPPRYRLPGCRWIEGQECNVTTDARPGDANWLEPRETFPIVHVQPEGKLFYLAQVQDKSRAIFIRIGRGRYYDLPETSRDFGESFID